MKERSFLVVTAVMLIGLSFLIAGCNSLIFGQANKLTISKRVNPIYVITNKGLTIIDSKTDSIVTKHYKLKGIRQSDIVAFYKSILFTSFAGTDFPFPVGSNTYMRNLRNGDNSYVSNLTIEQLVKQDHYLYGVGLERELVFVYDLKAQEFTSVAKLKGGEFPPQLCGFVFFPKKGKSLLLSDIDGIEIRSLDNRRTFYKRKMFNLGGIVIDKSEAVFFVGEYSNIKAKVLDFVNNEEEDLAIQFPEDFTAFCAENKLFVGASSSASDGPKSTNYVVYKLDSGKIIKKIKMDLRPYNCFKINNSLVFVDGPQKGKALNLKTASLEPTDISEQSVIQDGKIYSLRKDRVVVKQGNKLLKVIRLDSPARKPFGVTDNSVYNRAIFSSEPPSDNFYIFDSI